MHAWEMTISFYFFVTLKINFFFWNFNDENYFAKLCVVRKIKKYCAYFISFWPDYSNGTCLSLNIKYHNNDMLRGSMVEPSEPGVGTWVPKFRPLQWWPSVCQWEMHCQKTGNKSNQNDIRLNQYIVIAGKHIVKHINIA